MAEYVSRSKVEFELCGGNLPEKYKAFVRRVLNDRNLVPSADVAPVVHGYWDDSGRYKFPGGSTAVRCSKCGCGLTKSEYTLFNWDYCPVCGAKMDGGADHEAD